MVKKFVSLLNRVRLGKKYTKKIKNGTETTTVYWKKEDDVLECLKLFKSAVINDFNDINYNEGICSKCGKNIIIPETEDEGEFSFGYCELNPLDNTKVIRFYHPDCWFKHCFGKVEK